MAQNLDGIGVSSGTEEGSCPTRPEASCREEARLDAGGGFHSGSSMAKCVCEGIGEPCQWDVADRATVCWMEGQTQYA